MANATAAFDLPPLPSYTLAPQPDYISWFPDQYLALACPVIAYWVLSMFFHVIDVYDLFPQYRLHTPAEVLKRNHATRWEVCRDVILQQVIQTVVGLGLGYFDEEQAMTGKDDFNVAVWAQRIRIAQRAVPALLGFVGVNAGELAKRIALDYPTASSILAGGQYPSMLQVLAVNGESVTAPAFAPWEMVVAQAIYWVGIPAIQFIFAILVVDTWQYFLHRIMHTNQWLYGMPDSALGFNFAADLKLQPPSTPATTASTSPTPTAPSITTPSKASSSIPLAPASRTSSPA
jgi:sphinganine C4-monooxygenase